MKLPYEEQKYEPFAVLSGQFNATEIGIGSSRKEAYAVLVSSDKMNWLLVAPDGFILYTDLPVRFFELDFRPLVRLGSKYPTMGSAAIMVRIRMLPHIKYGQCLGSLARTLECAPDAEKARQNSSSPIRHLFGVRLAVD